MVSLLIFYMCVTENRYKYEAMVDSEPILFEILDACPQVILFFIV